MHFRNYLGTPLLTTAALLLVLASALEAPAQVSKSSGQKSADSLRSSAESPDFFEILRSGGDLLIKPLQDGQQEPTLDQPKWNSLNSPRATVFTFLEAMRHVEAGRDEAWPRVVKTLAIGEQNDLDPQQVAWQLKSVLDRLPEASPSSLPDQQRVRKEDIRRFAYFPDAVEHEWIWETLDEPPVGKIVLTRTADGQWLFNQQTTREADKLAESLQNIPPRSNGTQRGELFLRVFLPVFQESPWWAWLALAGGIAGGIALAYLGCKLLNKVAEKCTKSGWPTMGTAWKSIGKPATLLLVALGVLLGSAPLHTGAALEALRWSTIKVLLLLAVGWLIVDVIDLIVVSSRALLADRNDNYIQMGTTIIRRALRITVAVVLGVFVVQNLFSINLTALLGGLGLVALAISLAAQDAVKNLFGALMVFATCPFLVGDWIRFRGEIGQVEDVSLQVTKVRLLSGEIWTVPNMHFTTDAVENFSLRKYLTRMMDVAITYDTPPEKIEQALALLEEILTSDEVVQSGRCRLDENPPSISFNRFGSHYLNLRIYYYYYMSDSGQEVQRDVEQGWFTYLDHCSLVNQKIVERFNEAGIDFAFPTQTVYLTDDPDRKLQLTMHERNGEQHEQSEQVSGAGKGTGNRY